MLLKVGELARRAGLTVRTLHHYDSIGLLRPTGRSDGGYRLYGRDDVARLHGIQMLRRMGLSLADIARWLDGDAPVWPALLARQVEALDQEIARAQDLRERLTLMQAVLADGGQPQVADWLDILNRMSTLERHFSAGELRFVFERWKRCEAEWPPLLQAVREAMARGVPPEDLGLQPLARRWMELSARWMDGRLALLDRWGEMLRAHPQLPLPAGMDRTLLDYIETAIRLRREALERHLQADDLQRLDPTLEPQWEAFNARARRLIGQGLPAHGAAARRLARDWRGLVDRWVRHDGDLRERLLAAYEQEPVVQAGAAFPPDVLAFLRQAAARA